MPILCSVVVCDKNISAKFASCDGNFMEIVQQVISKIPDRDHKMTYSHGCYLFHYIAEDSKLYFCITDKLCQRSRAFLFLNEIRRRFTTNSKDFVNVLAAEMYRYSEDYSTITIRKGELDELNSIGVDSSESILGEKILYVDNVENLSYSTVTYVGKRPEVAEQITISVDNSRFYIIGIGILVVIIGFVIHIFGPISWVICISIVILSFVRSLLCSKDKTK